MASIRVQLPLYCDYLMHMTPDFDGGERAWHAAKPPAFSDPNESVNGKISWRLLFLRYAGRESVAARYLFSSRRGGRDCAVLAHKNKIELGDEDTRIRLRPVIPVGMLF